METHFLLASISIALFSVSFAVSIIQGYGLYRFKTISNLLIVQKRYPKMVIVEAIGVLFLFAIAIPLNTATSLQNAYFHVLSVISLICMMPAGHFIFGIEIARLWLISYDLHYLHSSKKEQWKTQIDASSANKDWYLRHRQSFGNTKYVVIASTVYFVVTAVVAVLTQIFLHTTTANMIDSATYVPLVATAIYLCHKLPATTDVNDTFLFHYEFRMTAYTLLVVMAAFFVLSIIEFVFEAEPVISTVTTVLMLLFTLTPAIPSLVSTIWIPKKILRMKSWRVKDDKEKPGVPATQRLKRTLSDEQECERFIQWMYGELSSEHMLCFIECVQFKEYLLSVSTNDTNDDDDSQGNMYQLYGNIPRSTIVTQPMESTVDGTTLQLATAAVSHSDDTSCKRIAHALYKKYIETYSEFEVNISGKLRNGFRRLDAEGWNVSAKQMMQRFDVLIEQMVNFMLQSYRRFEESGNGSRAALRSL